MSALSYNGVYLPYVTTNSFRQEAVYDDVGGTDWILTRFDIEVQAVITNAYLPAILSDGSGTALRDAGSNAADVMNVVRQKLLRPRRQLSFRCNGVELIPRIADNVGDVDSRNGPQPQSCDLVQLHDQVFLLTYRITAHYWENMQVDASNPERQTTDKVGRQVARNANGGPVLFNRWSETVDIDHAGFTKRTRDGKFVIRSDNAAGRIADQFRGQMAVVGVPKGFVRDSSQYTVSPDGLAVKYRVVDREVFKPPPPPAYRAEGEYTESTVGFGAQRWANVRLKLTGIKDISQSLLVDTAVKVCVQKLLLNGVNVVDPTGVITAAVQRAMIDTASITVGMYDNWVEVRMRARMQPQTRKNSTSRVAGIAGLRFGQYMTTTPLSQNSDYVPFHPDRGSARLLLQAAAYFDPSLANTRLVRETGQLSAGVEPGKAGTTREP